MGTIRVQRPGNRDDGWLSRQGDRVTLDVPGGRVHLDLSNWSSGGAMAYCRLSFEPVREGLTAPISGSRADYIEREVFDERHPVRRRYLPTHVMRGIPHPGGEDG